MRRISILLFILAIISVVLVLLCQSPLFKTKRLSARLPLYAITSLDSLYTIDSLLLSESDSIIEGNDYVGENGSCIIDFNNNKGLDYTKVIPSIPLNNQFLSTNTIYEINSDFNLEGERLMIPSNCVLLFNGGSINNGTIKGSKTQIQANTNSLIFSDVRIEGMWNVNKIYSKWFDIETNTNNTQNIYNLFALCSDNVVNNIYIHKHISYVTGVSAWNQALSSEGFIFMIPSNTYVHNSATFIVEPNSSKTSFLFNFYNVHDCSWEGGILVGDLKNHLSDKGEWGYGFSLRGAKNISISNVCCRDFWGDGINLQFCVDNKRLINCENIKITNVVCDRNRRQGLSIESGYGVIVRNCIFKNTGQERGTAPKFGIDIEPIPGNDGVITDNILITNCKFANNAGGGINFRSITASNIIVKDCEIDNKVFWSGNNSFGKQGFKFMNCSLGKVEFTEATEGIYFEDCTFSHFFGYKAGEEDNNKLVNFSLVRCTIYSGDYNYKGWYEGLINVSQLAARNVSGVVDGCVFTIGHDAKLNSIFAYRANDNMIVKNSVIKCEKEDLSLSCSAIFDSNTIELAKGTLVFTNKGTFTNNTVTYKTIIPSVGLAQFYNDAEINIIGNKFITPSAINQESLFSHERQAKNVRLYLRNNQIPCKSIDDFRLTGITVYSESNKSNVNRKL